MSDERCDEDQVVNFAGFQIIDDNKQKIHVMDLPKGIEMMMFGAEPNVAVIALGNGNVVKVDYVRGEIVGDKDHAD